MAALRAGLRARLRSVLAAAVLIGMFGGFVIAAAAGARRTDTALERFLSTYHASDVVLGDTSVAGLLGGVDLDRASRLPEVADAARLTPMLLFTGTTDTGRAVDINDVVPTASPDGRLGTDLDRFKILSGRRADPARIDEITAGHLAAKILGLHVGSTIKLRFYLTASLPHLLTTLLGQLEDRAAGRPGTVDFEDLADGPEITFHVVGIHASPVELPPVTTGIRPALHLTPTFHRTYTAALAHSEILFVRLHHGARDLPSFKTGVEELGGGRAVVFLNTRDDQVRKLQRSIHLQAVALWLLALAGGLGGGAVLSQALARQVLAEAGENTTLQVLGMTRRDRWLRTIAWSAVAGLVGATIAVAASVALSPLAPIGIARTLEPNAGLAVDGAVLIIGGVAIPVAVLLITAWPAWRAAGAGPIGSGPRTGVEPSRPSAVANALAGGGAPVPAVVGIRLAFERGRRRTAVPVRSSIVAAALALAVIVGAVTFGSSLRHLLDTPHLYGTAWDLEVGGSQLPDTSAQVVPGLRANPAVDAFAAGTTAQVEIGGVRVDALAIEQVKGRVVPVVLRGRAPGHSRRGAARISYARCPAWPSRRHRAGEARPVGRTDANRRDRSVPRSGRPRPAGPRRRDDARRASAANAERAPQSVPGAVRVGHRCRGRVATHAEGDGAGPHDAATQAGRLGELRRRVEPADGARSDVRNSGHGDAREHARQLGPTPPT